MQDTPPPLNAPSPVPTQPSTVSSWKKPVIIVCAVILSCCALTALGTAWWVKRNIYASPLMPVSLSATEQAALNAKLEKLELGDEVVSTQPVEAVDPETQRRTLQLSEKEINAFLAQHGLGEQVKLQLSKDQFSAAFLVPIDKSAPLFGGTTLRINLALSALMSEAGKLVVKVNDISLGGIPLPNAWLGDIKGLDLIASNLGSDPAVQRFAAGIKDFEIRQGTVKVVLNE